MRCAQTTRTNRSLLISARTRAQISVANPTMCVNLFSHTHTHTYPVRFATGRETNGTTVACTATNRFPRVSNIYGVENNAKSRPWHCCRGRKSSYDLHTNRIRRVRNYIMRTLIARIHHGRWRGHRTSFPTTTTVHTTTIVYPTLCIGRTLYIDLNILDRVQILVFSMIFKLCPPATHFRRPSLEQLQSHPVSHRMFCIPITTIQDGL